MPTRTLGTFKQQTYYQLPELEKICTEALESVGLLPGTPSAVRIERFVEKKFGDVAFADLGEGILGVTAFGLDGSKTIYVSSQFANTGENVEERRYRTTLAHEAGHCLLHDKLFQHEDTQTRPLFADYSDEAKPKVLCRDSNIASKGYSGQWWEYQANMAIGALLLPRQLVLDALGHLLEKRSFLGGMHLPEERRMEALSVCSQIFNVNPVVAEYRIDAIWPQMKTGQLTL